jgi:large subunit ribosomal protein L22
VSPVISQFVARHRFARITARKARLIADLIRGRTVNEALELLEFAPQRGAAFYLKVVRSAVANASLDENVDINRLVISDCRADDGPLLNGRLRFRPGPQGRAMPFAKRLSHLTVGVSELSDDGGAKDAKSPRKPKAEAETSSPTPAAEAAPAKPAQKRTGSRTGGKKKD